MKLFYLYILILAFLISCEPADENQNEEIEYNDPITGTRIAWDFSSKQKLVPVVGTTIGYSSYARAIELSNGNFMCVYEVDGRIEFIESTDKGTSWEAAVVLSPYVDGVARTVPEIIELSNGDIIISYNLRPSWANTDTNKKFAIALKISNDNGNTWSEEDIIFEASHTPDDGCWEPCVLELPTGEIQMYIANEADYTFSHEQNITMFRSADKGLTWSSGEIVSFSAGSRDGMPVPLYLEDSQEIVVAIEDNFQYNFKPAIVRTTINDNWASGFVGRDSNRAYALKHDVRTTAYQGAPYIRKLPSGNVILSYQGTEDRRGNNEMSNSTMYVEVGDKTATNFDNKTTPFDIPVGKFALWNSLSIMNGKVWAIASTNAFSGTIQEIWTISGQEINDYDLPKKSINIDGELDDFIQQSQFPFFVGHEGKTNASVNVTYDDSNIYFVALVNDENVYDNDGIIINIDPKNISSTKPVSGIFSFTASSNENFDAKEGYNGSWRASSATSVNIVTNKISTGYIIEFSLSWDTIGGKPDVGNRIGFSISLNEDKNGTEINYTEDMVLSDRDMPYTWATVISD